MNSLPPEWQYLAERGTLNLLIARVKLYQLRHHSTAVYSSQSQKIKIVLLSVAV